MRRTIARGLGVSLIALAICLSGLLCYELIVTRVDAASASTAAVDRLDAAWASTFVAPASASDPSAASTGSARASASVRATPATIATPTAGAPFGKVYIPRLHGQSWGVPLLQGVQPAQIDAGFAHFPDSALPGQVGNFAVAAHRATHLEPLAYVDRLRRGDTVYIQTKDAWFAYRLTHDRIVKPDAVWVVDPVPGRSGIEPVASLITLVTCEPRWGSASRWIWWGELHATYPDGRPPIPLATEG